MPVLKQVNEPYRGEDILENVVGYVLSSGDVGGSCRFGTCS